MSVIEKAILNSIPIWDECMNTRFVKELCMGILDEEKLKKYVIYDSIYLREYARCIAYLMSKAKGINEMKSLYSFLNFINENETSVRLRYLNKFSLSDEMINDYKLDDKANNYINHIIYYAKNGKADECIMALLPCMLSYEYIFNKLRFEYNDFKDNKYKDLLENYISENCKKKCQEWISFALGFCKDEKLIEIFRKSSLYELDFWNVCY